MVARGSVVVSCFISGRPRKMYHGTIAASAAVAMMRLAGSSGAAWTMARLAAKTTA